MSHRLDKNTAIAAMLASVTSPLSEKDLTAVVRSAQNITRAPLSPAIAKALHAHVTNMQIGVTLVSEKIADKRGDEAVESEDPLQSPELDEVVGLSGMVTLPSEAMSPSI